MQNPNSPEGAVLHRSRKWRRHGWGGKVRRQEAMHWSLRSSTGVTDEKKQH